MLNEPVDYGAERLPQRGGDRASTVPPPEDFPRRLIAAGPG
jgi:hypothetical protein